jgi:hypothetical protein
MRRIYITFSGKAYDTTTREIVDRAPGLGADEVWVYDDRWFIETYPQLMAANAWLFNTPVKFGFGWLFWKPFIILDALRRLEKGDVVLYTDADTYPIADLTCLFEGCARDGIFLFEAVGCENDRFTRKDCMIAMGLDDPKYYGRTHGCGRFQLFRAGSALGQQFLMEWYTYAINPMCQLREPSKYGPDLPGYTRHSNEQSILTMLAHKYNVPLHREACQFGWPATTHPEDTYPQLFHQQYCDGNRLDYSGSSYRNMDARG